MTMGARGNLLQTPWLAAAALLLLGGVACSSSRATDPTELLVVVPSAFDVEHSAHKVLYRVNERYPAPTTIKALVDAITAKSCVPLSDDPFNPPPGFKLNTWEQQKTKEGGVAKTWLAAWQCQGGLVQFTLL